MSEPSSSSVWRWRLLGIAPLYAGLTLAAATLASPSGDPRDPFGSLHRLFTPVAEVLPGAGVWPQYFELTSRIGGALPLSLVMIAVLMLIGVGAFARARSIATQLRNEAAIARDELIRERVRRQVK